MSAVLDLVEDFVEGAGDAVGDILEGVGDLAQNIVDEVVEPVMDTVGKVVESAMEDPIGTIAKVATAIVAPELLPLVSAADTVAHGGDLGDALKSAATTYVAQGIGGYAGQVGDQAAAAVEYGTDFGSQQTAMLAAQEAGLKTGVDLAGNVIGSAAAGIVRGQNPLQALISGGISAGTSAVTSQIEGFDSLPKGVQNAVNIAVATTLRGGDPSNALINAAINEGIAVARAGGADVSTPTYATAQEGSLAKTAEETAATQEAQTTEPGLPSVVPETPKTEEQPSGITSLVKDNGDGTFTRTMPDGSQVVEDSSGNPIETKSQTQAEFEKTAEETKPVSPTDWAKLYATPTTNPYTGETITGQDVSQYRPQDFGASTGEYWEEYEQSLKDMAQSGGFTSQWVANDDGTHTYTADDGSTMTVNQNGDIVGFTKATDTSYTPSSTASTSSGGLDNLYLNLLGAGAGAAGVAALAGSGSGGSQAQAPSVAPRNIVMDWNQADINAPEGGIAYGQQYLNPQFREVAAAGGGLMALASGGMAHGNLGGYSDGGRLLRGPGDGMSDSIPASIAQKQPARLADGEFVIPADVVSHLGNGSTDAGSRVLYDMMNKVRKARTGNPKQGKQINPKKFVPR